jgi:hypothetical protein
VSWVSAIEIRRQLRRQRRHLAVIAAVVALVGLLAVHHSGALMDIHEHAGIGAVLQMCLGVFTAVGVGLLTAAAGLRPLRRRHPNRGLLGRTATSVLPAPLARARHGPAAVSVSCVIRC